MPRTGVQIIIVGLLSALAAEARAHDEEWLLCDDGAVALSVYEHRAGADTRETDLRLLVGPRLFGGKLKEASAGRVKLLGVGDQGSFEGTIRVDFARSKVALKGRLTLDTGTFKLDSKLDCRELTGELTQ
jgi:hypothetical protein